ncbi:MULTISPECIES: ABC transporter substrate-binding protein [Agrobacterium]|uniref:ABC transporter substrate-binding protein n=1 Tax=Agrobacterium TaxID=357 RepID=UPI0005C91B76|nr:MULTISPECIES: ABC transporter substrate-binding protein [Agrobacterium]AUC12567.1 ABC transporter substrate-binding protein [Rhizobium sp. Y9]KIV63000.1 Copper ABC transporter, periplasmic substrate-binding component [Rhizobium sp. UR51a]MBA8799877.1 iron complex transport system substrate-binding protein [Agrobacterium sp. RC10-4-1]PTV76841.1 ABC transporter substrate-binding protein [Agrobacterium pusense]PTV77704.1 ABC transporter substrate-binding protein [Agrobacterium pusense]
MFHSGRLPVRAGFLAAALAVLPAATANAAETAYPLTIKSCGHDITFKQPPARAVSVGQSTTEVLYLLGLADKVVGTALWIGPVLADYEEANSRVERLADNDPSFEAVVGKRPDLVTTQFQWQIGPEGVVGTPAQFAELGIPVYTSPADCVGKDNSGGGDGVRKTGFTMDLIYQEIRDLAQIFNVQDRGEEVVNDLKKREDAARAKIASANGKLSAVFWFSSAELDIDPYVAGRNGAPGYIMSALGLENVIESDEEWPTVGWETIAKANPSVIVAGKMDRRRFPADDIAVKQKFLATDPVASIMPAVKEGHVFEMDAQAMNPTIRTIEGIETLAEAISAAGLAK